MDPSLSIPVSLLPGISPTAAHVLSFLFTSSYVGSIYISQTRLFTSTPTSSTSSTPGTITPPNGSEKTKAVEIGEPGIPSISATDKDGIVHPVEGRGPKIGSRDHPLTIRRRMKAVVCATGLSILGVYYVVKGLPPSPSLPGDGRDIQSWINAILPTTKLLGLPTGLTGDGRILPYLLAPSLLLGPLVAMYLDEELPIIGGRRYGEGIWERVKRGWREFGLVEVRNYLVVSLRCVLSGT